MDVLVRNGRVVDPFNGVDGLADIAISDGKIVRVAPGMDLGNVEDVLEAEGLLVVPGLVDVHTHIVWPYAKGLSCDMLLRSGVTTAVDMGGPVGEFVRDVRAHGHGLNVACLHALVPGKDVESGSAEQEEICDAIDAALDQGAFGIKIMGGHFPFSPDTTGRIIEECGKRGVYIAVHAGTTSTGSNLDGMLEAVSLSHGNPLHLAHINVYCRGETEPAHNELQRAFACLERTPRIVSESYLSVLGAGSAKVDVSGMVRGASTRSRLVRKGYTADRAGMTRAIREGYALVHGMKDGGFTFLEPEEGLSYWQDTHSETSCSFRIGHGGSLVSCLAAKRAGGSFAIDALASDGGGIPRNVIFPYGLRLVAMGYLSLRDLVRKTSLFPARMLGLVNKGHLGAGADADVAIFCPETGVARYTLVGGRVCMAEGRCGEGMSHAITTAQGVGALSRYAFATTVPDLAQSTFMLGHNGQPLYKEQLPD